ncbi:MAG: UDP-N-acetylglucosamine pyrophosphorylase [Deltaproteobacteria bacterium]|nr:UDP-N-acetylglucosamine pyrophosphorylase [Deltaproteobacteria bacterium]
MTDIDKGREILKRLQEKGVRIPCPEGVEIGADISSEKISGDGVEIHAGCRIYGAHTLIMAGAQLGYEAPATIHNCQIGRDVRLGGGFFDRSTFLEKSSMGSGAQIREACLLEEGARGAHTVGLKHTILFPFVTLGGLINFCDCLMAGGTDEKNHSEVGSSYIHFNYTPNQDKATPSLMGDVTRGVILNQSPIFLGGQGGLVGPVMLEYGTVVAAGTIVRKDILKKNVMLLGHPSISKTMPFHMGLYSNIKRIIKLNTIYIANLIALRRWYLDVRSKFMESGPMESALHKGAVEKIEMALEERLKRLGEVAAMMPGSIETYQEAVGAISEKTILKKKEFHERWQEMEHAFKECYDMKGEPLKRDRFLEVIERSTGRSGSDYIAAIKGFSEKESGMGVTWLQGLVDEIKRKAWSLLPSLGLQ